jgi:3-dehydrotetronate 4-kinase
MPDQKLRLGVIADDLTGASDVGGILARAGARCRLEVGVQKSKPAGDADAIIVALKSRSILAAEAIAQSLAALDRLRDAGARQIVFKICSTFDSTPEGNIGPVTEALLKALGAAGAVVCPAFPANGRTVYQGHLFVGDRLLSESGMERHPLNPMTDPDLCRWLSHQMTGKVGHLGLAALHADDAGARLATAFARGEKAVICDAIADSDLLRLTRLCRDHPLLVGGSALAQGLPANFGLAPAGPDAPQRPVPEGQGFVLAGSCSTATLSQIAHHARAHPVLRVTPDDLADPDAALSDALAFLAANADARPLVTSSAPAEVVAAAQARHGRETLAAKLDTFFARLAAEGLKAGLRFLVVAGGETSGAVAGALESAAFDVGSEVAPGVPTLYPETGVAAGVVLKSGNFGGPQFFDDALDALEAGR